MIKIRVKKKTKDCHNSIFNIHHCYYFSSNSSDIEIKKYRINTIRYYNINKLKIASVIFVNYTIGIKLEIESKVEMKQKSYD